MTKWPEMLDSLTSEKATDTLNGPLRVLWVTTAQKMSEAREEKRKKKAYKSEPQCPRSRRRPSVCTPVAVEQHVSTRGQKRTRTPAQGSNDITSVAEDEFVAQLML